MKHPWGDMLSPMATSLSIAGLIHHDSHSNPEIFFSKKISGLVYIEVLACTVIAKMFRVLKVKESGNKREEFLDYII